jgi:centrosomal protein CEP290
MLTYKISALQSMLEDSVPLTMLEAANRQFSELTAKYRDLLQKEQSLVRLAVMDLNMKKREKT